MMKSVKVKTGGHSRSNTSEGRAMSNNSKGSSKFSRRQVIRGIGGCGALAVLPWGDQVAAAATDQLVVADYGGVTTEVSRKAFYAPFQAATKVTVQEATMTGFAQIKVMVLAGNVQWDVASTEEQNMYIGGAEGLLEPIDYSIVKKEVLLPGAAQKFGVIKSYYSGNLAYNTTKFPTPPTGWADFWDVNRFPGARGMRNSPQENIEFALLADGVAPDKLYPLDLPRAFKKLSEIKPQVKVWWTSGAQSMQIIADNVVTMTPTWNGRVEGARRNGIPVELVWNQALLIGAPYIVPKGAPDKENAMKFIQFTLQPERMAQFATEFFSGPGVPAALDFVSPEVKKRLPTSPDNLKQMAHFNGEWYAQNGDNLNKQWESWMNS
jgi:putative spermidine/putrescine transport system substrate-binding protein